MAEHDGAASLDDLGPIDYVAVEFPDGQVGGAEFEVQKARILHP